MPLKVSCTPSNSSNRKQQCLSKLQRFLQYTPTFWSSALALYGVYWRDLIWDEVPVVFSTLPSLTVPLAPTMRMGAQFTSCDLLKVIWDQVTGLHCGSWCWGSHSALLSPLLCLWLLAHVSQPARADNVKLHLVTRTCLLNLVFFSICIMFHFKYFINTSWQKSVLMQSSQWKKVFH